MLDLIAVTLAGLHFGVLITYYSYAKGKWLPKPWNLQTDENYKPNITVILPTYNEAEIIEDRLENIWRQVYPSKSVDVIIVDSSTDGTADIVENWSYYHQNMPLKLIREKERHGKLYALKIAINNMSPETDVAVFTDADVFWEPDALSRAACYLADSAIGSVTASIQYTQNENTLLENTYRDYFNLVRVAESKFCSTPVHNGPFQAVRADFLREFGLPNFSGGDDSAFGSFIAFAGYRSVQADDITVKEPIRGNRLIRKVRRAQHLLLSFLTTKKYAKKSGFYNKSSFDKVWLVEWWLHIVNPWLLLISIILSIIDIALFGSILGLALMISGFSLLALRIFRTWILQQFYLTAAAVRNLWTKDTLWKRN
jgi:biofilm PGA synthesis N-glycosyltransferase PgaC